MVSVELTRAVPVIFGAVITAIGMPAPAEVRLVVVYPLRRAVTFTVRARPASLLVVVYVLAVAPAIEVPLRPASVAQASAGSLGCRSGTSEGDCG